MTKFSIALREISTYKEVLRSQVMNDLSIVASVFIQQFVLLFRPDQRRNLWFSSTYVLFMHLFKLD